MVAQGHRVIADHVHDLRAVLAQPLNVEKRAGETIATIQQQVIGDFIPDLANDRGLAG